MYSEGPECDEPPVDRIVECGEGCVGILQCSLCLLKDHFEVGDREGRVGWIVSGTISFAKGDEGFEVGYVFEMTCFGYRFHSLLF